MIRYKCTLSYIGTNYAGWQIQESGQNARKAIPTIQGELERVIFEVTKQNIRIHGAGRTDSGVHAEGQVMHFDLDESYPNKRNNTNNHEILIDKDIIHKSNIQYNSPKNTAKSPQEWQNIFHGKLSNDICVYKVEQVSADFHSRFSALKKTYAYTLWLGAYNIPPRLYPFIWAPGKINIELMQKALPYLYGTHDFAPHFAL